MQYTLIMINNMPIRYSFESNLLIKYRGVHFSLIFCPIEVEDCINLSKLV